MAMTKKEKEELELLRVKFEILDKIRKLEARLSPINLDAHQVGAILNIVYDIGYTAGKLSKDK